MTSYDEELASIVPSTVSGCSSFEFTVDSSSCPLVSSEGGGGVASAMVGVVTGDVTFSSDTLQIDIFTCCNDMDSLFGFSFLPDPSPSANSDSPSFTLALVVHASPGSSLISVKESSICFWAAFAAARLLVALVDRLTGSAFTSVPALDEEVVFAARERVLRFGLTEVLSRGCTSAGFNSMSVCCWCGALNRLSDGFEGTSFLFSRIDLRTVVLVTSRMTTSGGFSTVSGTFVLFVVLGEGVLKLGWLMTGASLLGERPWVGGLTTAAATRDLDFEIAGVLMVGSTGIGD